MIKISTYRIPQKKKRIIALITNYFLMVIYLICRVFTFRFLCKKDSSTLNLREMQKILIIRADGLGDVVTSTPFLAQLREIFPNSEITLLAATASKELIEPMPVFDEIIYFDLPWFFKGQKQKLTKLLRLIAAMRKEKFELAIDIRGDFRNNILMYLVKTKYRLGFGITGCGFLLSHVITIPENSHMVTASLSLIEYLNPQDQGEHRLKLWIPDEDRNFADGFLKANGIDPAGKNVVVTIHPGGKWYGRKWAPENYARIADSSIDTYNAVVILAGSAGLLLFSSIAIVSLWFMIKAFFMAQTSFLKAVTAGLIMAFISLLVQNFFSLTVEVFPFNLYYWYFVGLGVSLLAIVKKEAV